MVKNVFKILGTVIICILLVALGVNVLYPNLVTQVVGSVEKGIKAGTGLAIDLNGDGSAGSVGATTSSSSQKSITVGGATEWTASDTASDTDTDTE